MARRVAVAVLALAASAAVAQDSFLSSLPTCSTLDGTEYVYMEQALGVAAKKCTTLAFSALFGISLDLGNDSVLESTRLRSIQTSGDTNSIFTEAPADELLIDLSKDWPKADQADALAADGANCAAGNYPLGVDAAGAVQDCTADDDLPDAGEVTEPMLDAIDAPADEECLTWETGDDFEWQACGGGGGDSIQVEDGDNAGTFTAMVDADFDDSGDINFTRAAGPPDVLTATVRADAVALGTDTTGDYVSGVTANQGLLKTGTEAATLGLIDCAENEILKNTGAGGTAWTCAADATGGSATITVEEDNATVDAAVTNLDFTEPNATLVTSSPAGEANVDMSKYALLEGRTGQTLNGGVTSTQSLTLRSNTQTGAQKITLDGSLNTIGIFPGADDGTDTDLRLTTGSTAVMHLASGSNFSIADSTGTTHFNFTDAGTLTVSGASEVARIESDGDIGTDACVRIGQSDSGAGSDCICWAADPGMHLFYDADCDFTEDVGEDDLSVDATGGAGSGNYVEGSIALSGGSGYFSTSVTAAWVTATSVIVCGSFGTTADGLTPEAVAVAGLTWTVTSRLVGVAFQLSVFSPYGIEGTVRYHCTGATP